MSDVDKKLQVINDGKMASLAAHHISALITERQMVLMRELSTNFRLGRIDQATLLTSVAGFCALEDLEQQMKLRISKGERASQDINKEQIIYDDRC